MKKGLLWSFCCWLCWTSAWAQLPEGLLKGQVLSADGTPAAYAVVSLMGTSIGKEVQPDGQFTLKAPAGRYTLRVQAMGVGKLELAVQVKEAQTTLLPELKLKNNAVQLQDVVVTGQFTPQSMRQSVYQVRVISQERIQQRGATKIQDVLNNELGIRFSQDLSLGGSNLELMGLSGQNVKVLLDGVPLIGRQGTSNEININQIDVNTIERIEIVEGPMSVVYGADALAGVINIITKKPGEEKLTVAARLLEETAGKEYGFTEGIHNQSLQIGWQRKGWQVSGGVTRNYFGGWQGNAPERDKEWHPKAQWLGNFRTGYRSQHLEIWYRLDALDENIIDENAFVGNQASDQKYLSKRFMHQAQANGRISDVLSFTGLASYTDYSRRTQSTTVDKGTGKRTLALGAGLQDETLFKGFTFRGTLPYRVSPVLALQPGVDVNLESGSGGRIQTGIQRIQDYAAFLSAEINPVAAISLRPGIRFIHNSVYEAPSAVPSLNTRFRLNEAMDLRLSYANGFRAPSLRELYFNFFDASHAIIGNPDLKAELSHSFNGSLSWQLLRTEAARLSSTLGGFYNHIRNQITTGFSAENSQVTTYLNINRYKTTGGTWTNTLHWKSLEATVGASYIGRYNQLNGEQSNLDEFLWSPEVNANLVYQFQRLGTSLSFFYKYTGKLPSYQISTVAGQQAPYLAQIDSYHWADATVTKTLSRLLTLTGGVKNLFNVTRIRNSSPDTGAAHSTGGARPIGYGRSFFLGLNLQWAKN